MGTHPINLTLRFVLELIILISAGVWGWYRGAGWSRFILVIGLPILVSILWGVFAVPGDPSRSGKTVISTPGVIRLAIELGLFVFAAWALIDLGNTQLAWIFGIISGIHYVSSYDRILWLTRH